MKIPNTVEVTICESCSRAMKKPFIAQRYCYRFGHPLRDCIVTKGQLEIIKEASYG